MRFTRRLAALLFIALSLSGCATPPTPASSPEAPRPLAIASWNLEWLADPAILHASGFWISCARREWANVRTRSDLPFCDVYRRRGIDSVETYAARKIEPLRQALAELASRGIDLIAVQEVQRRAALEAVLPPGFKVLCFTTRSDAQNVGYAVRESANLDASCREIRSLSLEVDPEVTRPVRRGLELVLRTQGREIAILNVHLKSACARGRMDDAGNEACRTLQRQAAPLERWIEEQANAGRRFVVIGDWNRDLDDEIEHDYPARAGGSDPTGAPQPQQVRNLWPEINDLAPPASAMVLSRVDRSAAARGGCFARLDHLAVSATLRAELDPASLDGGRPAARLVKGPDGASDHCALEAVLRFR